MEKGDPVIATKKISTGFFGSVDKGTEGVIVDCGHWTTWYEVAFDSHDKPVRCDEDEIRPSKR